MEQAEIERLVGGAPRLALDEIANDPRLPLARKSYLDRFLEVYSGDPFLVRLLIESGRFCVFLVVAVLEAPEDPARRETWLTVGRLKQAMALFGLASDRQINSLLRRLCSVGFLELSPASGDRRVRILRPTERLRAYNPRLARRPFRPAGDSLSQHDYAPVLRRDRQFHDLYRRTSMPFLPLGAKLLFYAPDIMLFFDRAAGVLVLAALLQAAMAAPEAPHAAVPYADVGERFGVSRPMCGKCWSRPNRPAWSNCTPAAAAASRFCRGFGRAMIVGLAAGMYIHDMVYVATERAARQAVKAG